MNKCVENVTLQADDPEKKVPCDYIVYLHSPGLIHGAYIDQLPFSLPSGRVAAAGLSTFGIRCWS